MIVIPSVSIGNVPQLAVDLIIHTYGFELVKSLDDESLTPFVGPLDHTDDADLPHGIATAVQLFRLHESYVVQLRSPPIMGQKRQFIKTLFEQFSRDGVPTDEVLFVGSVNAGMSERPQINQISRLQGPNNDGVMVLPESGFMNEALSEITNYKAIVSWVHEGNNFADARNLARELVKDLGLPDREFKPPVSWNRVYGKDAPLGLEQGIYS